MVMYTSPPWDLVPLQCVSLKYLLVWSVQGGVLVLVVVLVVVVVVLPCVVYG